MRIKLIKLIIYCKIGLKCYKETMVEEDRDKSCDEHLLKMKCNTKQ